MEDNKVGSKRIISTNQFGDFEVADDLIFIFPNGVLGFEELREFVLISEEETAPFKWLLSVEDPTIGFPILSPWIIDLNYEAGKNFDADKQVAFVVVNLMGEHGAITANLKAPIVFDIEKHQGHQLILPTEKYSTNFVINPKKD